MKPINYQALQDVSRAIKIIRKNSKQWQVNPDKIGVIGFSAGGHLAASLAVHYNKDFLKDNMNFSNKPNCVALGYPVILTGEFQHKKSIINLLGNSPSNELLKFMSLEKNVTSQVPPTFLWHSQDDLNVPIENSFLFVAELLKIKFLLKIIFFKKEATVTQLQIFNGKNMAMIHTTLLLLH